MLTLGVLNRVPAMSATRLGPRLDDLGRKQLMQQVLQRVGSKSDDFRQFIQKSGWGPCQLDEDSENDPGEAKQVDQEMSGESTRSASGGQSSKIEQTPCSQRSLRLVNQRLTLYELEILGYFFETGVVDELDVSWNRLSWKEAAEIGNILRLDSCLRLIAAWNSFGPRGARAIGASLSGCTQLRHLNLSANKLGAEGAAALCAGLSENQSVVSLDLSFNDLRAAGAHEVSAMLKVNRSIKSINLRSNAMGPPGAFALADALRVNREINEIIVVDNNIGPEGAEAIAGFFQGSIPVLLRGIRGHVEQKAMR
ncbi:Nucleotide-binding oligomerization domain-containing protein 1 [Hondaea fermentalgiana]|uniref:Nucleotide-binding oligomerization domain-containing protein 1 n=1 Tax=Hondaea fermentalgiana TaxID=2315210 RepID=A0A2R5GRB4_9STRA|nr:Nucleotide-binding oligomerization domain-containing protein 1 [Hondaea fermentalgiana]|eukprot:GBG33135.1 Nucleotide-binding oligomerization domain-containing protein 1 [Hondaea fermentalgiana]